MQKEGYREIPFNYTSADDAKVVRLLLGRRAWELLESLRTERITGRSARLLMRILGDIFVLHRNSFVFQELLDSPLRRKTFFRDCASDLEVIEANAGGNAKVGELVQMSRRLLSSLKDRLHALPGKRSDFRSEVGRVIGEENVFFDPFSLVSHSTDATDWRLFLPFAVVTPCREDVVPRLLEKLGELRYAVIPRGAGTGLTGGSVPVSADCVIVNTEKLNRIRGLKTIKLHDSRTVNLLELEAGVITEQAIEFAARENLVFATDPTSAWASTIGGNIAENAGGKTAVLWGTAIDNLFSYRIAVPGGEHLLVKRSHPPLKKIHPDDVVRFEISDSSGTFVKAIELQGREIRKEGLWKDITNKALGGLPGLQKEGTDGIITSATFVLHPKYPLKSTYCLEFFGDSMDEAAEVILHLSEAFPVGDEEVLMALEHFDQEYVQAIAYKVKAPRKEIPKAVLLIDMVAHTPKQLNRGHQTLTALIGGYSNSFCFQAKGPEEAAEFWRDRKRLGAIAARTNAFKLNEDIVLPLEALASFARFVEEMNLQEDQLNHQEVIEAIKNRLTEPHSDADPGYLETRSEQVGDLCDSYAGLAGSATTEDLKDGVLLHQFLKDIRDFYRGYAQLVSETAQIADKLRSRRIVIATHMHAGDGNVHVNIPVFSNDRTMMERAMAAADAVMSKAVRLGGVVSGEHGIGFTKLKYLDQSLIEALNEYRREVDPQGMMNPGKLSDLDVPDQVFTPSFNLLELEARILQYGSLETLSEKIAKCVRCGRCKPDCCVFYPARNLFFHPRNKNLAIGALIEALLFDTQRSRSTRFEALRHLETIADHCTLCHKCLKPCPVDIDTGEVSVLERTILADRDYKRVALPTRLVLQYLENRSPILNSFFRNWLLRGGVWGQRLAARALSPALKQTTFLPKATGYLRSPLTQVPASGLWKHLPKCGPSQALLLEPPGAAQSTVFYFPGCGSERLFSDVAHAVLYILAKSGTRVILPPPFLCCGFPARANARKKQHDRIVLRDTIIFSQIREMFSYLDFDACIVSCGTCKESLSELECGEIFGCRIEDASRFASDKGLEAKLQGDYLYHTPCHDSLEGEALKLLSRREKTRVQMTSHCCSEAGTLSLSRPDISQAMLDRKREALLQALKTGNGAPSKILTNCPSCLQGLGRQNLHGMEVSHLAVELARSAGGPDWKKEFPTLVRKAEVVTF